MSNALVRSSVIIVLVGLSCTPKTAREVDLGQQTWIHGSADCSTNHDPLIQVVPYQEHTWILRQNKCNHYEAPFIFLLVGKEQSLLMDTGAPTDEKLFPLRQVVDSILMANGTNKKLIVAHTHSHIDHVAGDEQFKRRADTEVIGLSWDIVQKYFGFDKTNSRSTIELGRRSVEVLSIPGHHQTSLAFYDRQTGILFTGDTFYPGRLYVRDWPAFRKSIKLMLGFAKKKNIKQFIGNHIEMTSKKGIDYPVGSTYQPDEHILPLTLGQLKELDDALEILGDSPKREVHDHFIIFPK